MAMQMQRAFNSKMLTKMVRYTILAGHYDENNIFIEGRKKRNNMWGVIKSGNKFSQFEEGQALHAEDGGNRFSDFRTLFVTDRFELKLQDKIAYKGKYYNVLQESDEVEFGFRSFLIEKSEEWTP